MKISLQLDMAWPEEARKLIVAGDFEGAADAFMRAGQALPEMFVAAWNAKLAEFGQGRRILMRVERYGNRFRIVGIALDKTWDAEPDLSD